MTRNLFASVVVVFCASSVCAQPPSYAKQIRPFLAKYCLECHNAKEAKAGLSLETHKAMMDGADGGAVVTPGKPDDSRLVLLLEGKDTPKMPPKKAKFQPKADEIKLVRAWVAAGAKDDAASVKIELPAIKPKADVLPPVTGLAYTNGATHRLYFVRGVALLRVDFPNNDTIVDQGRVAWTPVTPFTTLYAVPRSNDVLAARGKNAMCPTGALAPIDVIHRHDDAILDLSMDSSGSWAASASYDTQIVLWQWKNQKYFHRLKEHSDAVYGLAFNPDGTMLASVSADRAMKVFDVEKGKLLYTLAHATDWLYTVAWSPDGKYLVSGGVDKSIRVYEMSLLAKGERLNIKLRQSVFAHEGAVVKVLFSSDSKTLYSVGEDRVIKAWDVATMTERKVYDKQPETVLCMALREDAGQLIVGRYDGIVQLIDMKTGKVAHEFGETKNKPGARATGAGSPSLALRAGNSPASAPAIKTPTTLNATLDRAGAVHYYRFDAKKSQPLGIHLEMKSKIDPVLILTDMQGRSLAESYEGHLGHTFADAGSYAIGVRDREYRGGSDFKYRLKLGDIPIVTAVFPMGLARGTTGDIHLDGVFLPKKSISVTVPKDAKLGHAIPLDVGKGVLGKAQIVAGEFPDIVPGGKLSVPATANGRISKDNQNDLWTFNAKKGQRLVVEVHACRIGSRLDSVIEILDAKHQPVPRAVLRSQAKTHVTFRDHDSAQGNIRIEAWSELAIDDYLFVGIDLMKIQALPTHPDADCNFFATQGQRIGYLDTTPTHHANGEPMYKVSVHPPGTTFPPNGYPVFTLYYRNDDGGPGFGRDSRILFDPPADGQYKVRIADARGMGGVNFGYRLTVRQPRESFVLRAAPKTPSVSKGGAIPITITAERIDGYDGPIAVHVKHLPKGLHLPPTTIEAGNFTTTVALYADADAKLPAKAPRVILEGTSHDTGIPFAFLGDFDLPKLIGPGDIVTTTQESEVAIVPGKQARMTVTIERRNGFNGRVPLEVRGLPHGVKVLDIGLNGILVNPNETTRTVVIYAEPWVRSQDHPFVVLAKREGKNTEHAAKSVVLRVR